MSLRPSTENLENALNSLNRAVAQPTDEFIRDAVIRRFGITLELAWKTMKKFLEYGGTAPLGVPKDVIRTAAQAGWIKDPALWILFLDERNETSHLYNEDVAERVFQTALKLPLAVEELLGTIRKTP